MDQHLRDQARRFRPGSLGEKLVEILAQDFAKDDEHENHRDYSDLLSKAEEWVDYNMSGAYPEPDAPVIAISGESL